MFTACSESHVPVSLHMDLNSFLATLQWRCPANFVSCLCNWLAIAIRPRSSGCLSRTACAQTCSDLMVCPVACKCNLFSSFSVCHLQHHQWLLGYYHFAFDFSQCSCFAGQWHLCVQIKPHPKLIQEFLKSMWPLLRRAKRGTRSVGFFTKGSPRVLVGPRFFSKCSFFLKMFNFSSKCSFFSQKVQVAKERAKTKVKGRMPKKLKLSQNVPCFSQNAPFCSQNVPFCSQNVPFGSQNVPFGLCSSQNVPLSSQNVPFFFSKNTFPSKEIKKKLKIS